MRVQRRKGTCFGHKKAFCPASPCGLTISGDGSRPRLMVALEESVMTSADCMCADGSCWSSAAAGIAAVMAASECPVRESPG